MPQMPKRVKFRKSQRGVVRGNAQRGNTVTYGEYGLQSLEGGWLSGISSSRWNVTPASRTVQAGWAGADAASGAQLTRARWVGMAISALASGSQHTMMS